MSIQVRQVNITINQNGKVNQTKLNSLRGIDLSTIPIESILTMDEFNTFFFLVDADIYPLSKYHRFKNVLEFIYDSMETVYTTKKSNIIFRKNTPNTTPKNVKPKSLFQQLVERLLYKRNYSWAYSEYVKYDKGKQINGFNGFKKVLQDSLPKLIPNEPINDLKQYYEKIQEDLLYYMKNPTVLGTRQVLKIFEKVKDNTKIALNIYYNDLEVNTKHKNAADINQMLEQIKDRNPIDRDGNPIDRDNNIRETYILIEIGGNIVIIKKKVDSKTQQSLYTYSNIFNLLYDTIENNLINILYIDKDNNNYLVYNKFIIYSYFLDFFEITLINYMISYKDILLRIIDLLEPGVKGTILNFINALDYIKYLYNIRQDIEQIILNKSQLPVTSVKNTSILNQNSLLPLLLPLPLPLSNQPNINNSSILRKINQLTQNKQSYRVEFTQLEKVRMEQNTILEELQHQLHDLNSLFTKVTPINNRNDTKYLLIPNNIKKNFKNPNNPKNTKSIFKIPITMHSSHKYLNKFNLSKEKSTSIRLFELENNTIYYGTWTFNKAFILKSDTTIYTASSLFKLLSIKQMDVITPRSNSSINAVKVTRDNIPYEQYNHVFKTFLKYYIHMEDARQYANPFRHDLNAEIAKIEEDIDIIQQEIKQINATIANKRTELTSINNRIQALKNEQNAKKARRNAEKAQQNAEKARRNAAEKARRNAAVKEQENAAEKAQENAAEKARRNIAEKQDKIQNIIKSIPNLQKQITSNPNNIPSNILQKLNFTNKKTDFLLISYNEAGEGYNIYDCFPILMKVMTEDPQIIVVCTQDSATKRFEHAKPDALEHHYQHILGEYLKYQGYVVNKIDASEVALGNSFSIDTFSKRLYPISQKGTGVRTRVYIKYKRTNIRNSVTQKKSRSSDAILTKIDELDIAVLNYKLFQKKNNSQKVVSKLTKIIAEFNLKELVTNGYWVFFCGDNITTNNNKTNIITNNILLDVMKLDVIKYKNQIKIESYDFPRKSSHKLLYYTMNFYNRDNTSTVTAVKNNPTNQLKHIVTTEKEGKTNNRNKQPQNPVSTPNDIILLHNINVFRL